MKTKICIIVGLLGYLTLCVHAETRTYNNLRYTGDWTGNAIIIEDNELVYDTIFYDYVNGIEQTAYDSDSLVYTVHSSDSLITIIPIGAQFANNTYYYGETTNIRLYYNASAPSAITPDKCIASGMIDTIIFSLDGIQENQDYLWVLPNGMDSIDSDAHNTWMKVQTNGVPGDYPIQVQGIGSGTCGNSPVITDTFTIDTALFSIGTDVYRTKRNFYLDPWDLEDIREYKWFINGNYEGNSTEVSVHSNTISAFVEVYVTFNDGCRQYASFNFNSGSTRMATHKAENNMEITTTERNLSEFKVYPNPSQEHINVMFPSFDSYLIQLFDMNGRVVYRKVLDADNIVIPTDNLSNGIYSVVVTQGDYKLYKQVIVNK